MARRAVIAFVASTCLATFAGAELPPGLTRDEDRCQRELGPATDGFGAAIARCVVRCDRRAARGKHPRSACLPPYDGKTRACIAGARQHERDRILRGCARDCPECYAGGDCGTFGEGALDVTAVVVDGLVRPVLCDDSASPDRISPAEQRCRFGTGIALAQAAEAWGRCYVACRRRFIGSDARSGPIGGPCTSTTLQTRAVAACVSRVTRRARDTIRQWCANAPECLPDPTALVSVVAEQIRSDYDGLIFCSSPSGAFVEAE